MLKTVLYFGNSDLIKTGSFAISNSDMSRQFVEKSNIGSLFPQFSRFIAAHTSRAAFLRALILLEKATFVIVLTVISLHSIAAITQERLSLQKQLLTNPHDIAPHVALAKHYYQNNNAEKLAQQLALVDWLITFNSRYANILGTSTQGSGQLADLQKTLSQREETIDFWKSFIAKNPAYRDGHLALVRLYLQEDAIEKARGAWAAAAAIDPNNETVVLLAERLQ